MDSVQLLRSYLTDRKMYIEVDGEKSEKTTLNNIGCPQGSCLGPLLYLLYTTSLNNLFENNTRVMFADDTAVVVQLENPKLDLENVLSKALNHFNAIKLKLNVEKTEILSNIDPLSIEIGSTKLRTLSKKTSRKYLGFNLNADLSWQDHVDMVTKRMRFGLMNLNKIKTNTCTKRVLYDSLVRSHFSYGSGAWNILLNKKQMKQMCMVQKAAIRSIHNLKRKNTHRGCLQGKQNLKIQ